MVERRHSLSSVLDDKVVLHTDGGGKAFATRKPVVGAKAVAQFIIAVTRARAHDLSAVRWGCDLFPRRRHYEVAAQHCEGGEAIVLVKLTIAKTGAVKTQFGRAKLDGGPVEGKSGGVPFRLADNPGNDMEADAYRRATEEALRRCAELV